MRPFKKLRFIAVIVAALAVIATPALLFAHARLVRSTPAADATLTASPTSLSLWFSERPELRFSTLKLTDAAGADVPLGPIAKLPSDAMALMASIAAPLSSGRYTVSWRTAADDGHATSGTFSFVVSTLAAPPPAAVVDTPLVRRAPNTIVAPAVETSLPTAVRWAELVGLLTLIGSLTFALFVVPRADLPAEVVADARERARRLATAVLFLFAVATLWRLAAQSNLVQDASSARMAAMMTVVTDTGWGAGWLIGAVGVVITIAGLVMARSVPLGWLVAGIGTIAIAVSESLTGHAAASKQVALATAVDVAHVLAAGGWVGGLAAIAICGLAATRRAEVKGGTRLSHQLVRSFHRSAVECVGILLVTAVVAIGVAWYRLGQPTVFWSTPYGRLLLLKMGFAAVLLGFGWFHWRTAVIPEWTDDTAFRFRRSVAVELLVGAGIVAVTAVLISTGLTRS